MNTEEKTVGTDEQRTQTAQRTSGHKGTVSAHCSCVIVPPCPLPLCPQFLPAMTSFHFLLLPGRRTRATSLKLIFLNLMFRGPPCTNTVGHALSPSFTDANKSWTWSCDMPASIIAFLIYRFQCQIYLFHVSNFLKITFSSPQRASLLGRFRLLWKISRAKLLVQ